MISSNFTTQANTPKSLSIAILIVYIVLLQPVTFVFFRHGLRSWLAWLPLQSLCLVRIIGSGIQIHADETHTTSTAALVLNNIGLAPLLLATLGILHEARTARNPTLRQKLEWLLVITFHSFVTLAMILVIIGVVRLTGAHPQESDTKFGKIGGVILIVCWLVLVGWTAVSFQSPQYKRQAEGYHTGTKLLYGVIIAMAFVGVRELDVLLSDFVTSHTFLTSLAIKVCLNVVPEMIATSIFVAAGLAARNNRGEIKYQKAGGRVSVLVD